MTKEEKFNELYQKLVTENIRDIETAKQEAKIEKIKNNIFIVISVLLSLFSVLRLSFYDT